MSALLLPGNEPLSPSQFRTQHAREAQLNGLKKVQTHSSVRSIEQRKKIVKHALARALSTRRDDDDGDDDHTFVVVVPISIQLCATQSV